MLDQILFPAYLNAQDKPQQERNRGVQLLYIILLPTDL